MGTSCCECGMSRVFHSLRLMTFNWSSSTDTGHSGIEVMETALRCAVILVRVVRGCPKQRRTPMKERTVAWRYFKELLGYP